MRPRRDTRAFLRARSASKGARQIICMRPGEPAAQASLWFYTLQVRRYLTSMTTTVSTKGQIVLPAEIRRQDGIEPGQEFEIERIDRGEYRLVRRQPRSEERRVG